MVTNLNCVIRAKEFLRAALVILFLFMAGIQCNAQVPKTAQASIQNSPSVIRQQKEIKILIADIGSMPLSETSILYPPDEWYLGKREGGKFAEDMFKTGWALLQIIPINARQYYFVFVK
jgi:hypothetical protein